MTEVVGAAAAQTYRARMRDKAARLGDGEDAKSVDSSDFEPAEKLYAGVKTGMRPISRQARKDGGPVNGAHAHANPSRAPRAKGGGFGEAFVNRDQKAANEDREGHRDNGGMRTGGRVGRKEGGYIPRQGGPSETRDLKRRTASSDVGGKDARPAAEDGRQGRASGGRAHRDMGGPLAPTIAAGIGGAGRMGFNFPGNRAQMLKKGGTAQEKYGHPPSCKCSSCRPGKANGGGAGDDDDEPPDLSARRPPAPSLNRPEGRGEGEPTAQQLHGRKSDWRKVGDAVFGSRTVHAKGGKVAKADGGGTKNYPKDAPVWGEHTVIKRAPSGEETVFGGQGRKLSKEYATHTANRWNAWSDQHDTAMRQYAHKGNRNPVPAPRYSVEGPPSPEEAAKSQKQSEMGYEEIPPGRAKGGRSKKADGGETAPAPAPAKPRYQVYNHRTGETIGTYNNRTRALNVLDKKDNEYGGYAHTIRTLATGGRAARASGGKSGKGKTNINIIIGTPGGMRHPDMAAPQPGQNPNLAIRPPPAPMPMPGPGGAPAPGAPMPMAMPVMPMGAGAPPGGGPPPPQMPPRKRGGRVMKAGAGSGIGRLEKIGSSPP